jgi:hypothetical protein
VRNSASLFSVLSLSVALFASPAALADAKKKVNLGEVGAAAKVDPSAVALLRSTAEKELSALDLRGAKKDAILSISLVRLEAQREGVSCVVSATLRTKNDGNIFAILEGRAIASGTEESAKHDSMKGAVQGALNRIPEALK